MESKKEIITSLNGTLEFQIVELVEKDYAAADALVKQHINEINVNRDGFLVNDIMAMPNVAAKYAVPFIAALTSSKAGIRLLESNPELFLKCNLDKEFETSHGKISILHRLIRTPCRVVLYQRHDLLLACNLNSAHSKGKYAGQSVLFLLLSYGPQDTVDMLLATPKILDTIYSSDLIFFHLARNFKKLFTDNPNLATERFLNKTVSFEYFPRRFAGMPIWFYMICNETNNSRLINKTELFPKFDYDFLKDPDFKISPGFEKIITDKGRDYNFFKYMLVNNKLPPQFLSSIKQSLAVQILCSTHTDAFKLADGGAWGPLLTLLKKEPWLCAAMNEHNNTLLHCLVEQVNKIPQIRQLHFLATHAELLQCLAPCRGIYNNDNKTPVMCAVNGQLKQALRGEVTQLQEGFELLVLNNKTNWRLLVSVMSGEACFPPSHQDQLKVLLDAKFESEHDFLLKKIMTFESFDNQLDEDTLRSIAQLIEKVEQDREVIKVQSWRRSPLSSQQADTLLVLMKNLTALIEYALKEQLVLFNTLKQRHKDRPVEAGAPIKKARVSQQSMFTPKTADDDQAHTATDIRTIL